MCPLTPKAASMGTDKPNYASEYTTEQLERSRRALLQLAVALGDHAGDVVLVGGLVPVFLVDQDSSTGRDGHVGSADVDLGLSIVVVDGHRYDELSRRLAGRGFLPGRNSAGNPTKQRWVFESDDSIVVDFLIDEAQTGHPPWGRVMHLGRDLGALRVQGLSLAFQDVADRVVRGETLDGAYAERTIRVCGPAAFIVLKALAFRNRDARKDAYDLEYVLRSIDGGLDLVADRFRALCDDPAAILALSLLREDFASEAATGPRAASEFLFRRINPDFVADFVGNVRHFLKLVGQVPGAET